MLLAGCIRRTLYLSILLTLMPTLGIITYIRLDSREQAIAAAREQVAEVTRAIASRKQLLIESARTLLSAAAHATSVRVFERELTVELLQELTNRYPFANDLALTNARGKILVAAVAGTVGTSVADRPEYMAMSARKAFEVGFFPTGSHDGASSLRFAYPVIDAENQVTGALVGGLQSRDVLLPAAGELRQGMVVLYDGKGDVLAHSSEKNEAEPAVAIWETLRGREGDRDAFSLAARDGNAYIVAYERLRTAAGALPYLTVAVAIPRSTVYAAGNRILLDTIALLALAGVTAWGIVFFLGRRTILQPMAHLLSVTRKAAEGNFSCKAATVVLQGDMLMFARTFDTMVDNITRYDTELKLAKTAAESADMAKGEFLAKMNHAVRTPMNTVIGMAYLVSKTEMSPRQQGYVSKIYVAANTLLGIINDILDFSKIESGHMHIECVPFRLEDILDNLAAIVSQKAEEKGVEVVFRMDRNIPPTMLGDPLRLGQVLINLTNNAVKFTAKGEVVISCTVAENRSDRVLLRFAVRDTGIGIPPEQVERLFEAFAQVDGSITRRFGGTGLGLAITRHLLELMGGSIQVESVCGRGSTFTFTIPLGYEASPDMNAQRDGAHCSAARVLVVDDNQSAREALTALLADLMLPGEAVASAEEAFDALTQAEREHNPFSMVFMDWRMPGMDGVEATRVLHSRLGLKQAPPVVIVTPFGREDALTQAVKAGAAGILYKPVHKEHLYDSIMALLQGKDKSAASPDIFRAVQEAQHQNSLVPGVRILLVEDDPVNQQIAQELLEDAGAVVATASTGAEGVAALENSLSEAPFDLVLMDLQMPEMDGYEATKRIRGNPRFARVPIVAMTAHAMVEERLRCLEAGMNDHVSKPLEVDRFFSTLRAWLSPGKTDGTAVADAVGIAGDAGNPAPTPEPAETGAASPASTPEALVALRTLEILLADSDAAATTYVEDHETLLRQALPNHVYADMARAVSVFEFDEALIILREAGRASG